MRKRPLNSATLATATHKELTRVSDRTGAQVGVWMINKCKVQMIGKDRYNIEESPKRRGRKIEKKEYKRKILLYASIPMNKVSLHVHFCVLVSVILLSMHRTV